MHKLKILILTSLALSAFAANSILCRMALGQGVIDATSFTSIRLVSGAIVLALFLNRTKITIKNIRNSSLSALMLFIYAAAFSFAYISLTTGTGALILFGAVQITMILSSLLSGKRLTTREWIGTLTAFIGFVYLVLPGVDAPPITGFALMSVAGIAWGVYTLNGKGSSEPLADTAFNFLLTLPLVVALSLFGLSTTSISVEGVILAILSGAIASGLGYAIWYSVLRELSTVQAAVSQLSVPIIAAIGGILFMSEEISLRLSIASVMILGGILLLINKSPAKKRS